MENAAEINIEEAHLWGRNEFYDFYIGRVGDRWAGFAVGVIDETQRMAFMLPGVSEGFNVGCVDREEAFRLTVAIILDGAGGYGPVDEWLDDTYRLVDVEQFRDQYSGEICHPSQWDETFYDNHG